MSEVEPTEVPIEISPEQLSKEALWGVIENFILREGTDYGQIEMTFEKKAEQVQKQIEKGEIKIVFDLTSESVSLLTAADFRRRYKPPRL
ncbi:MAG TPA: YheU family protein [Pseudobdellovibrionaceae bacterium]|nr:YheU family protein [Pseudobdellovibrionaceae bacterium]